MSSRERRARTLQQYLSGGLLPCVVVYFLSLCTLSPSVHADLLSRAAQAHRNTFHHCAPPSTASESPAPPPASHRGTTTPLCCTLTEGQKAISTSSVQTDLSPLLLLTLLPSNADAFGQGACELHTFHTLHSSHSPPLYLVHTVLLI